MGCSRLKEAEKSSCFRVTTKSGKNLGGVCIAPGKNVGERDVIYIKDDVARSMRSTTELVNTLLKEGADLNDIDKTVSWMRETMQPVPSPPKTQQSNTTQRGT